MVGLYLFVYTNEVESFGIWNWMGRGNVCGEGMEFIFCFLKVSVSSAAYEDVEVNFIDFTSLGDMTSI